MSQAERLGEIQLRTPREIIANSTRKAIRSEPMITTQLFKGKRCEVYDVMAHNGREVIVRFSKFGTAHFEQERTIIESCKEAGVPVPDVLLVDRLEAVGEQETGISVESKLRGKPLNELLPTMSEDEKKAVVQKAGEILTKIHSIQTEGYGNIDTFPRGRYQTQEEFFSRRKRHKPHIINDAHLLGMDEEFVGRCVDTLVAVYPGLLQYDTHSGLLHNDFYPKHIFIHEGEISGIIDFENPESGSPFHEFAKWDHRYRGELPLTDLIEGYGDKTVLTDKFDDLLHLHKLHLSIRWIGYLRVNNLFDKWHKEAVERNLKDDYAYFNTV